MRLIRVAIVIAALAAPAAALPASADISRTARFDSFGQRVGCGVQLKQLGGISCFSNALPSEELDGYVELHAHGSPTTGERGDSPWRNGRSSTLRPGDTWKRAGVRCHRF